MNIPGDGVSDEEIREIYRVYRKIAVVGMSRNPDKPSHYVPRYLMERGYEIYPINPTADEILGKKVYKSISDLPEDVEILNVFRPSEEIPGIVDEALKKNFKVIWLQEGIYNEDIIKAREKGVTTIWNRCMMKEYKRLFE
ncbi:TPA: CoA-binding protein [Candidatus Geothermarchaeota archaeon]|nr:CoA-binding protein [Candidatus Geothermarchaeota archaeon]